MSSSVASPSLRDVSEPFEPRFAPLSDRAGFRLCCRRVRRANEPCRRAAGRCRRGDLCRQSVAADRRQRFRATRPDRRAERPPAAHLDQQRGRSSTGLAVLFLRRRALAACLAHGRGRYGAVRQLGRHAASCGHARWRVLGALAAAVARCRRSPTTSCSVARAATAGAGVRRSWSTTTAPPSEHGFVSLWAQSDDALGAAWLDGRNTVAADALRDRMRTPAMTATPVR